jgi:glucose-6-phosphate isomerase
MTEPVPLAELAEFEALRRDASRLEATTLRQLFAEDPTRARRFSLEAAGWHYDFSKQRVDEAALADLLALARSRHLEARRDAMLSGAHVNTTEDRPALHTALRLPEGASLVVDGVDVAAPVHAVLDRMAALAEAVRQGAWVGQTGRRIRHVVNVGIGGSDLGPAMAYEALRAFATDELDVAFVSNVDATALVEATAGCDPAETLFIISSKTFTTAETMANARSARDWLRQGLGQDAPVDRHMVAVSNDAEAVARFGIDPAHCFELFEWVGGRYSMDSAIGLSTMVAIGPERFAEMLAGFHEMDVHFATAPLEANLPVLHGLLCVWNRSVLGHATWGVFPYEQYLRRFPAYLQQLSMESNGKHVDVAGRPVTTETGAIWWGEPGTNGQHSFYQLLHQGTTVVPADLICFARSANELGEHHDLLVANALAQAQALAFGRTLEEVLAEGGDPAVAPWRTMEGDRPTSVLLAEALTPHRLGSLVALYEHSTFVQGAIWGIDSFDQWGVELGKQLASTVAAQLLDDQPAPAGQDPSTTALIERYRALRHGTGR